MAILLVVVKLGASMIVAMVVLTIVQLVASVVLPLVICIPVLPS
jgi:hypothetical protein